MVLTTNVGIIKAGANTYLFNLMGNAFDLTDYQKKDLDTAVEGATTVEGALGALASNKVEKASMSYSTSETNTGKTWIDGKPIYRKVINVGNIPDTTSKSTAHNIANIGTIIICEGRAVVNTTAKTSIGLPYINTDSSTVCIQVYANVTDVVVKTASSVWTAYAGFVILEYTKTTD